MVDVRTRGDVTLAAFAPSALAILTRDSGHGLLRTIAPGDVRGVDAALDGPMFSALGNELARMRFALYDRARGVDLPGAEPDRGMFIGVDRGRPITGAGRGYAQRADVRVQFYPSLVRDGDSMVGTPDPNPENDYRAALCILRDGRLAFAVGRSPMGVFAEKLRSLGAVHAGYTDGGSSTSLLLPQGRRGAPRPRAVASWLVVKGSGSGIGLLAGLLGVAGGLWYASRRR